MQIILHIRGVTHLGRAVAPLFLFDQLTLDIIVPGRPVGAGNNEFNRRRRFA